MADYRDKKESFRPSLRVAEYLKREVATGRKSAFINSCIEEKIEKKKMSHLQAAVEIIKEKRRTAIKLNELDNALYELVQEKPEIAIKINQIEKETEKEILDEKLIDKAKRQLPEVLH